MKLKEMLAAKKKELADLGLMLKDANVTDETLEKANALVKEIADLETQIAKAEKAAEILKVIGTTDSSKSSEPEKMSEMDEFVKKCAEIKDKKTGASQHFKAYNTTITAPQIADVDRSIAPQPDRTAAASLFTNTQISGNAVTYFLQGAFETNGGISPTAQGNKKPQASTSFAGTTLALSKIAAYVKETDEILADAAFLASEVQNTLIYQLGVVEDAHIINAIGSTVGIGAETYDGANVTFADGILSAILKVKADSAYDASVVVVNPADLKTLLTAKDQNGQYYGGGYFVGAYGNGGVGIPASIWGVQIFTSSAVSQGSALIAAKQAVKIYKKGGLDVKVYEQNEDDALYNKVTLLAEERLACAVVDLKGVVLLASSAS